MNTDIHKFTLRHARYREGTCYISEQHIHLLDEYKWHINRDGYIVARHYTPALGNHNVYLHKLVLPTTDHVYFRNGNKRDVTVTNLGVGVITRKLATVEWN